MNDASLWSKCFDGRDELFVPSNSAPAEGAEVLADIMVTGGPRMILRGKVLARQEIGADGRRGCRIKFSRTERLKLDFLDNCLKGVSANRRRRRRLPLKLPVTLRIGGERSYTVTRDINEDGAFIVTPKPPALGSVVTFEVTLPGEGDPLVLHGEVRHVSAGEAGDAGGMGVLFQLTEEDRDNVAAAIEALEDDLYMGALPADVVA